VMQPVFKDHGIEGEEILALVAYLKAAAVSGQGESPASTLRFLLAGFGGAAFLLMLFDFLWRKRYRATRGPLIARQRRHAALDPNS